MPFLSSLFKKMSIFVECSSLFYFNGGFSKSANPCIYLEYGGELTVSKLKRLFLQILSGGIFSGYQHIYVQIAFCVCTIYKYRI